MPKIIVFNDPHYTRHAPVNRKETYPREILAKFRQITDLAREHKCQAIGCTGDWFHRKGKVTFTEQNDLLTMLNNWRRKGFDTIGIVGNHDIAGHKLESFNNRAVGGLIRSGSLHLLDYDDYTTGTKNDRLIVTGTSYFHGCDDNDTNRLKMYGREIKKPKGAVHVHFAHGTLINKGSFFGNYTTAPELIELLAENGCLPDIIVCGHLHFSEGVREYKNPIDPSKKVLVCRVGSLGRVSKDDFDRKPSALLIATKQGQFAAKELPIGKGLVFEPDESTPGQDPKDHEDRIKGFVRILSERADQFSVTDHRPLLKETAEELGYGDDVIDIAIEAIEKR